jgi:hypothetical protein
MSQDYSDPFTYRSQPRHHNSGLYGIPGGCDLCDALLLVEHLGGGEFQVSVSHDEDCDLAENDDGPAVTTPFTGR